MYGINATKKALQLIAVDPSPDLLDQQEIMRLKG